MSFQGTMKRTVVLECEHQLIFQVMPELGESLFCVRCNNWRKVVRTISNFKIRCQACKYGRHFGYNKDAAIEYGHRHLTKHREHSVLLYNGLEVIDVLHAPASAESRLNFEGEPPY